MTLVIVTGGIDLAVGSIVGFTAVCFSMMSIWWSWPWWMSVPAALGIGAGCGAVSGSLVAWPRLQPFIATLAMMVFARGMAKTVSWRGEVSTALPNGDGTFRYVQVPELFRTIDLLIPAGNLSMVTVVFLAIAGVAGVLLARHIWGRDLYAIGGNEEAARLSGVAVKRGKLLAYVACGLCAAVAGICQAAQEQQGDPEAGGGYELTAIAIVVIGGDESDGRARAHGADAAGYHHDRVP